MKRALDIVVSAAGLFCASPVLLPVMALISLQDGHSPFYVAPRVGRGDVDFLMLKLRSMVVNADKSGVDSTGASDRRITPIGRFVRRYKLDDAVLWDVARMVHEADLADERYDAPEAPGLDVICRGLSMVADDQQVLAVTGPLFDGLYEYRRRALLLGRDPA